MSNTMKLFGMGIKQNDHYIVPLMSHDLSCVYEGFGHCGSIFISGLPGASHLPALKASNIRAILTVARQSSLGHSRDDIPRYLCVPAEDHEGFDLSAYFDQTFQFIDEARKHTNVLVHCRAGISRSATVTAAYLMQKFSYSMHTVLNLISRKRSKISPNRGFLMQLSRIPVRRRNDSLPSSLQEEKSLGKVWKSRRATSSNKKNYSAKDHIVESSQVLRLHPVPNQTQKSETIKCSQSVTLSSTTAPQNPIKQHRKKEHPKDTRVGMKIARIKKAMVKDKLARESCKDELQNKEDSEEVKDENVFSCLLQSNTYYRKTYPR